MIHATEIEIVKNLVQFEYGDVYYDLHNDYLLNNLMLNSGIVSLEFRHIKDDYSAYMHFFDVEVSYLKLADLTNVEDMTIDSIYRGRLEKEGQLLEFSDSGKGYFYLELYEGYRMEFWATGLDMS